MVPAIGDVGRRASETHLRHLAGPLVGLEVLCLLEVEHAGDDVARHRLDLGVVLEHHIVVELPRVGDLRLQVLELRLADP